jgi:hypothetical protein
MGVLEEDNITLILNELALLVDTVDLSPSTRATLVLHSLLSEELLESSRSFPSIVVRNLAGDVVKDVSLRDTVGSVCTEPSHDWAKVTKKVAIQGGEGTTGEGKLGSTVMREERVGVLEEGDENEPMVDPKIGDKVGLEDGEESESVDSETNSGEPKEDTDVGDDNLPVVVRGEHHSGGVEVVSAFGVPLLTGGVPYEV